jgi:chromosome partitioning protein
VVFNQKGGVGKSSITCNLGAISAQHGFKILVIDLDPQGNSTHYLLGNDAKSTNTVADYFSQTLSFNLIPKKSQEFFTATPFEHFSLITSDSELESIEKKLESRNKAYKLRDLLNNLDNEFDHIFIDTAPALDFHTMSLLIGADRVLIPFNCDAFSRHALYNILGIIEEMREDHNENLVVERVIVNQFQPRANLPKRIVEERQAEKQPLLPIYLNSSIKMREPHQVCKPLIHFAPNHPLTIKFIELHEHNSSDTKVVRKRLPQQRKPPSCYTVYSLFLKFLSNKPEKFRQKKESHWLSGKPLKDKNT